MTPPPKRKRGLDEPVKCFIVRCFAHGLGAVRIAQLVQDEFGVTLDKGHVGNYNPLGQRGAQSLSKRLKLLYETERAKLLAEIDAIPIANKAVRMRLLQDHYDQAVATRNMRAALGILEQAAKEVGGSLTNEVKVKHAGKIGVEDVTTDEKKAVVADRLMEAMERMALSVGATAAPGSAATH